MGAMKRTAPTDTPVESKLDRLVLEKERRVLIPLDRSTIYRMRKAGTFPEPVRLGKRVNAWRESQLVEWAEARKKAR
jgi:prophage regulatory protein